MIEIDVMSNSYKLQHTIICKHVNVSWYILLCAVWYNCMINDLFSSILNSSVKMYSIGAKIIKPHNEKPDELENTISQVCACLIILFYVYLCHRFVYKVDNGAWIT